MPTCIARNMPMAIPIELINSSFNWYQAGAEEDSRCDRSGRGRRRKDWLMATSTMRLPWSIPGAYARRIGTWHPTKTGWRWNPIWEWTPMSWTFSEAAARTKASNSKPRQSTNRLGTAPMPLTSQPCLRVSASTLEASLASDPRRYSGRIPRKGLQP